MSGFFTTYVAALRSVGAAATMTMAGFYLHRRNFINSEGKNALAVMAQQLTLPALFFTKLINCPQNFSTDKCPNITDVLGDVWVLLLWPLYVVGCGLLVGEIVARLSSTPAEQRRTVLASCAFSNATGLPITLLSVIHANAPQSTAIGQVDPNVFLSVYLILYPVLQWGIGGWLLAPGEADESVDPLTNRKKGVRHVLNLPDPENQSLEESAVVRMVRELSLTDLLEAPRRKSHWSEQIRLISDRPVISETAEIPDPPEDSDSLVATLAHVLPKAFQPPVVGAILGILVASYTPLRALFVDLTTRAHHAPLGWLFDGLYSIGQSSVPTNMCLLGVNLSMASQFKESTSNLVSRKTMAAVVIGKMVIMPIIGIVSAIILKNYFWNIPSDIAGPFYLVLMIVTITPTGNTVMVMVELSGSKAKEGVAQMIGVQYALVPILLSLSVMAVVQVASSW